MAPASRAKDRVDARVFDRVEFARESGLLQRVIPLTPIDRAVTVAQFSSFEVRPPW
jgi:hypothetical protein